MLDVEVVSKSLVPMVYVFILLLVKKLVMAYINANISFSQVYHAQKIQPPLEKVVNVVWSMAIPTKLSVPAQTIWPITAKNSI